MEILQSVTAIGRERWSRFAAAAGANVFFSYDFLHSVEKNPLSQPSEPFYLVLRDGPDRLAAALILYLQETVDPFGPPDGGVTRMLVGHVWHCYETMVLSAGPLGAEPVRALCAAMARLAAGTGAATCGLVNVPWDGPLASQLAAAGLRGQETTPRYQLRPAPGSTLGDHLAGVGRASRRSLRQYMRRAQRVGAEISFEVGATVLDDDVLALCKATADKHAPGYYPPVELTALIKSLGENCRILRIDLDGGLLAVSICLFDDQRAHFWAGGCRYPEEFNWSPQYVLFGAEIEQGLATGRPIVEFGRRNDEFKRRYGLRPQRLGRFVLNGGTNE
ncbi:GNAT family N-acetyltransferase [Planosporangium sp. 12N6]|uniref:GNAT family N-acetyltransferase n=1 Tax=Planosporangium spinosum TaxID=3402278 RepID=UPI003CEEAB93